MSATGDPKEGEIPVVAAVVRRGARVLVGRRPAGKRHEGLWEFPGGKVLPEESVPEAVRRELREELALELTRLGPELLRVRDPGSAFRIQFVEVDARGHPRAFEHSELRWVTAAEARALELAPADARFVREALPELERPIRSRRGD